jgi:HSP90 family molecular chaperone
MQTATTSMAQNDDIQPIISLARGLVSNASCADADRVAVDVHSRDDSATVIVEDNGRGMTETQFERFFEPTGGDDPFAIGEEVIAATRRDGRTLLVDSEDTGEYPIVEVDRDREEGTRVEVRGIDAPDDLTERLSAETLRKRLALDESDWTALVTVREME